MKISELIQKDKIEKIKNDNQVINKAAAIKQQNFENKLTYYNYLKLKYAAQLKNESLPINIKAAIETKLYKINNYISELKKNSGQWKHKAPNIYKIIKVDKILLFNCYSNFFYIFC